MYRNRRRYSKKEIEEVIFRIQSGELSISKARQVYGIGGSMTVYRWLDRYGSTVEEDLRNYKMAKKKESLSLKKQNRSLELESAQLRLEYYETIFALAKEEYGVDFKKILGERSRVPIKDEESSEPVPDSV